MTDSAGNPLSLVQQPVLTYASSSSVSSVSSLSSSYTNLMLTGTATTATGNALANRILGNATPNVINGGGHADWLDGGDGSDLYLIATSAEHPLGEEICDSGSASSGSDEIRFTATAAGQVLTLQPGIRGIERVVIGRHRFQRQHQRHHQPQPQRQRGGRGPGAHRQQRRQWSGGHGPGRHAHRRPRP